MRAVDALRLTSISMVFMAISFFLLIAVFIVLIILVYILVRKGEVIQNGIFVNFCCLRVFWGCGFNCVCVGGGCLIFGLSGCVILGFSLI